MITFGPFGQKGMPKGKQNCLSSYKIILYWSELYNAHRGKPSRPMLVGDMRWNGQPKESELVLLKKYKYS